MIKSHALLVLYAARNNTSITSFNYRSEYFINSFFFFSNVINKWNKLNINISKVTSHNNFTNSLLSFIQRLHIDTFRIHMLGCSC